MKRGCDNGIHEDPVGMLSPSLSALCRREPKCIGRKLLATTVQSVDDRFDLLVSTVHFNVRSSCAEDRKHDNLDVCACAMSP